MKLLVLLESKEIDHFKDGVGFAGFLPVERPFFRRSGRAFDWVLFGGRKLDVDNLRLLDKIIEVEVHLYSVH